LEAAAPAFAKVLSPLASARQGSLERGVGCGSGEARGASDSGQKNRCPCPSLLGFGHKWSTQAKQASSVGKQAVLGVSCGRPGRSKKAILMDMDGHVNVH